MAKGYIKTYRIEFETPALRRDAETWAIWSYLRMYAAHATRCYRFKGQEVTLMPGQIATSSLDMSKRLGVERSKIDRVLRSFQRHGFIMQEISNKSRLITILNQPGEEEEHLKDYNK